VLLRRKVDLCSYLRCDFPYVPAYQFPTHTFNFPTSLIRNVTQMPLQWPLISPGDVTSSNVEKPLYSRLSSPPAGSHDISPNLDPLRPLMPSKPHPLPSVRREDRPLCARRSLSRLSRMRRASDEPRRCCDHSA
jgi:hypothetical protein